MKPHLRITLGIGVLALLQVSAWLVYRTLEVKRSNERRTEFHYEPMTGDASAGDVALERPDGTTLRVSEYGERPVLLHFWATWCAPCRTELPTLLELAREKDTDVVFLLVSVDEAWAPVRHYFDDSVPTEVVRDATGSARTRFGIGTLPETVVMTPSGRPAARMRGARQWTSTSAREALAALVAAGG